MCTKNLNIRPRITKIPNYLIYKKGTNSAMHYPQEEFIFISTLGDHNWGELLVHKSNREFRDDYKGPSLAIDFIKTKIHDKGLGKFIMDFAKKYSVKNGCNGYIVLKADNSLENDRAAAIFYRKQGFTTFDKKLDKLMDKYIKVNKKGNYKEIKSTLMFYPSPEKKKNTFFKFFETLKNKFTKIID